MISKGMREKPQNSLSSNLTIQGWRALANAAQALLQIASAALGEAVSSPVATPSHPLPHASGATVSETINDLLLAKARSGRSDRYLRALKNSLSKFSRGRARQPLAGVTTEQIEIWLVESGWAARTKKGYLGDVRTLFNFAVKRGYIDRTPANAVELARPGASLIGIQTPEQVSAVLEIARERDPSVVRVMAVRYFAGLRASEAERLEESDIRVDQGVIEVRAAISKTGRRRLVTILPALSAWLALGGTLPLRSVGKRMRPFRAQVLKAGIPWPANAPRHSYCSYHIAAFESVGKTALSAGNSEAMIFGHYMALVTKGEAERFWAIRPLSPDRVTTPGAVTPAGSLVSVQADKR